MLYINNQTQCFGISVEIKGWCPPTTLRFLFRTDMRPVSPNRALFVEPSNFLFIAIEYKLLHKNAFSKSPQARYNQD